jgi:hypothetical protein
MDRAPGLRLPCPRSLETAQSIVPGGGKAAGPESITTAGGYGFRPAPLSRLGRNDELKGSVRLIRREPPPARFGGSNAAAIARNLGKS